MEKIHSYKYSEIISRITFPPIFKFKSENVLIVRCQPAVLGNPQAARPAPLLSALQHREHATSGETAERLAADHRGLLEVEGRDRDAQARREAQPAGSGALAEGEREADQGEQLAASLDHPEQGVEGTD